MLCSQLEFHGDLIATSDLHPVNDLGQNHLLTRRCGNVQNLRPFLCTLKLFLLGLEFLVIGLLFLQQCLQLHARIGLLGFLLFNQFADGIQRQLAFAGQRFKGFVLQCG